MKPRVGSGGQPVDSSYLAKWSPFPSLSGSSMGDSVASRLVYSLPTINETEGTNVVVSENVLEEQCSSRQADSRLATGPEGSEKLGTDSLNLLQQNESNEKEKKSRMWKWFKVGRLNPLLPSGVDKGGFVFTEEKLELAPFAKVFATGPDNPLENKNNFYCMWFRRNFSLRTRGLYE